MYSNEHPILQKFIEVMEIIPLLFEEEVSIALTNTKGFIKTVPCESIPLVASYQDVLPAGSAAIEAMEQRKTVIRNIPDTVYGVPFRSHATPIITNNGEVIGSVLVAKNQEKSSKVTMTSEIITNQMEKIASVMENLQRHNEDLENMNEKIHVYVTQSLENTKNSEEILNMISRVATQTNLLGLNASIEAARVGSAGKGFAVVSKEIGRLSQTTKESVQTSNEIIERIYSSVNNIADTVQKSRQVQMNQMGEIDGMNSSILELQAIAEELYQIALTL